MIRLIKFILMFNRRVFIGFNLVLYALLLFFFNLVNTANLVSNLLFIFFAALVLLMKAIYEFTIYRKEIGVLKTLGGSVFQLVVLRVAEKSIYILAAWFCLFILKLITGILILKTALWSEMLALFWIEFGISISYYLFATLQDISLLLKEE